MAPVNETRVLALSLSPRDECFGLNENKLLQHFPFAFVMSIIVSIIFIFRIIFYVKNLKKQKEKGYSYYTDDDNNNITRVADAGSRQSSV